MKTLIFVAHPDLEKSVVNKEWVEAIRRELPDVDVHILHEARRQKEFDVRAEQKLVDSYDNIVFQFPVYWFNCPALLKQWMDDVLTPDWAYMENFALEGKKIAMAVSAGSSAEDYSPNGSVGKNMEDVLQPMCLSFKYLKAKYCGLHACYDAVGIGKDALKENAEEFVRFIEAL